MWMAGQAAVVAAGAVRRCPVQPAAVAVRSRPACITLHHACCTAPRHCISSLHHFYKLASDVTQLFLIYNEGPPTRRPRGYTQFNTSEAMHTPSCCCCLHPNCAPSACLRTRISPVAYTETPA